MAVEHRQKMQELGVGMPVPVDNDDVGQQLVDRAQAEEVPHAKELPAREHVADEVPADGLSEARERAKEVLEACEGTLVSLDAQLYARLHPDYAPRIAVAATKQGRELGKIGARVG